MDEANFQSANDIYVGRVFSKKSTFVDLGQHILTKNSIYQILEMTKKLFQAENEFSVFEFFKKSTFVDP